MFCLVSLEFKLLLKTSFTNVIILRNRRFKIPKCVVGSICKLNNSYEKSRRVYIFIYFFQVGRRKEG